MLSYLAEFEDVFGPLRLLGYISVRAILAAGLSFLLGLFLVPKLTGWLHDFKAHQVLRSEDQVGSLAQLHSHKEGTPTMGGIMIYLSVTCSALLLMRPNPYTATAWVVYTALSLLGFADDYLKIALRNTEGVPQKVKLGAQVLVGIACFVFLSLHPDSAESARQLWVPFLKVPLMLWMPWYLAIAFFALVLSATSNAINLSDGLDGLAIGCVIPVSLAYGAMAYLSGNMNTAAYLNLPYVPDVGELSVACAALTGGSLAFLWFNAHPATIFMGDTGSLGIGGLIGSIALMTHQAFTLIIIGGIFVTEALSVILQVGSFRLRGKRIFLCAPLHHHFQKKGIAESKIVARFWIVAILLAVCGLATLKLR